MPVRRFSVGSFVVVSMLATLAMGGGASARSHRNRSKPAKSTEPEQKPPKESVKERDDATETDEGAAPESEPKAEPKSESKLPEPSVEPHVAEPAPELKVAPRPTPVPTVEAAPPSASDGSVGFSDRLYIRSPGGEVVLFPGGRVQVDAAAFPRQTPKSGAYLRRARVELTGWLGRIFYFDVSADVAPSPPEGAEPMAPSALPATDNYVALAPFGDRFILQAGQFDVPFTLENRTSDAYTDFIERSMAVRLLGAPRNKEVGAMVHGLLGALYYSAGVFNGDGPDFRNFDNQPDAIGRVTLSPFTSSDSLLRRLTVGGSAWYGRHILGPTFPVQATPGGVRFLIPQWNSGQPNQPTRPLELREHGYVAAFAGELSIPFGTHAGLRGEVVYKQQQLAEVETTTVNGPVTALGTPQLNALAAYGELWLWLAGDERMLPAPGLQLPARIDGRYRRAFEDGLMFAVRGEMVKEDLIDTQAALADPTRATTRVISGTAGVNYWRGSFARISINYVLNMWSGTSETIKALRAESLLEHELLLRFAAAF